MYLIISIDTEWDRHKTNSGQITVENLKSLPRFQRLCETYGIIPSYLCTHEVAEDNWFYKFAKPLISDNKIEIGCHLHPWSSPPFKKERLLEIKKTPFPNEYSDFTFEKKLINLKNKLEDRFGPQKVYRAGRFGLSVSHIPILSKHGFKVDTSITPGVSWKNASGWHDNSGPDFSSYSTTPFYWKFNDKEILLEIPITIINSARETVKKVYQKGGIYKKVGRIFGYKNEWFRPLPIKNDAKRLKQILFECKKRGYEYTVLMMHSNEFHPKFNPYFNTDDKIDDLFKNLDDLFAYSKSLGVIPICFSSAIK